MNIWYEAYIRPLYHYTGKDMKMSNEFKAGDLVFEIDARNGVELITLSATISDTFNIRGSSICYLSDGRRGPYAEIPSLLHATPENHQALVTLYGEDAVPKLPVRGSELTKKLLEKQKYVLCLVSHISDDKARSVNPPKLRIVTGVDGDYFNTPGGILAEFAVPIDMDGNEITEIE